MKTNVKYWEVEQPITLKGEKSVARIYIEHGKIQAFPRVENTPHGIGRGATIDLATMDNETLFELKIAINEAIEHQLKKRVR